MENVTLQKQSVTSNIECSGTFLSNSRETLLNSVGHLSEKFAVSIHFSQLKDGLLSIVVKNRKESKVEINLVMQSENSLPAVSFGTESYYLTDIFSVPQSDEKSRNKRLRFYPLAGEQHLDPEKALGCPPNFLLSELEERLSRAPIQFRFETDNLKGLPTVQLGLLSIESVESN